MNSNDYGNYRNKAACKNTEIPAVLDQIYRACLPERSGEIAEYIPELSEVDPEKLAIAIATTDGKYYPVGDDEFPLALESLSKPFVYGVALQQCTSLRFREPMAKNGGRLHLHLRAALRHLPPADNAGLGFLSWRDGDRLQMALQARSRSADPLPASAVLQFNQGDDPGCSTRHFVGGYVLM